MRRPLLLGLMLALIGAAGATEAVYKSVDADGNVTYSANPPSGSVSSKPIDLPQEPSANQRREALEVQRELSKSASRLKRELAQSQRSRNAKVQNAESALNQARDKLNEAKEKRVSDYQGLAQGGRILKEAYFERVRNAESRLKAAEKALAEAKRDAR